MAFYWGECILIDSFAKAIDVGVLVSFFMLFRSVYGRLSRSLFFIHSG